MWDFWSLSPESLHQVTILMSDRGLPQSYRNIDGFGSHTYSFINARNERHWVKVHFKIVAVLLGVGWRGPLRWLPFYWATVVAIRAAGTAVGDTLAGRNMLGLPISTAVTGIVFIILLLAWKETARQEKAFAT